MPRKKKAKTALEDISVPAYTHRHRPLENAERRERKREDELLRYHEYLRRLRREFPGLFR